MITFLIILLKINLVLILFAAAYYLVLRRLTFYVINRLFLVFGILFSTVYPFINLTDFFHRQQQINQQVVAFVPKLNEKIFNLVPVKFIESNWQLLSVVFYVGVLLMALRLIIQFVSLYKMHQKSAPGDVADFTVRILDEPVSPFSFWQTIYINPSLHQEKELQTILAHEQIHVKEWHSLDIILAELSVVFYWFNPGVWLMKRAVKENLEFITDEKILKKGIDKKAYQYSLLDVGSLIPSVAIVNNFNLSDLKKRIKMMNVKRSSRLTLSRYMLVLPMLLLTTLAFTVTKKDLKKHLQPIKQVLESVNLIAKEKINKPFFVHKLNTKRKSNIFYLKLDHQPTDTTVDFTYSIKAGNVKTDTIKVNNFDFPASVDPIKISDNNLINHLKGKVVGSLLISRTDTLAGSEKGSAGKVENVNVRFNTGTVPVTGSPKDKVIRVTGYGIKLKGTPDSLKANGVITYNGQKLSPEEISKINPDDIETVVVGKPTDAKLKEIIVIGRKKP